MGLASTSGTTIELRCAAVLADAASGGYRLGKSDSGVFYTAGHLGNREWRLMRNYL
ncbi:MAG: hypothetical protein HFH00_12030 [Dorea sp.]|nr:hypothetical protein [Dorea sp.]